MSEHQSLLTPLAPLQFILTTIQLMKIKFDIKSCNFQQYHLCLTNLVLDSN